MRKWLYQLLPILGFLLILITLTSALLPEGDRQQRKQSIALRQIGHDYLTVEGDTTTLIPAVVEQTNGTLSLALKREIDYDRLVGITRQVVQRYALNEAYTLSLEDCQTGEIFLGSFFSIAQTADSLGEAACTGRDQAARCANISLAFHHETGKLPGSLPYFFFGLGCVLLFAVPVLRKLQPGAAATAAPETPPAPLPEIVNDEIALGPTLIFSLSAQTLRQGEKTSELTYREAKLLAFLASQPNQILDRSTIQDAVWGEEGIIVGRSLDVFISRIRKKIAAAEGVEIQTVHGVGYRLRM